MQTGGGLVTIQHDTAQQITIGAGGLPVASAIQVSTQSIEFGSQFVGLNYPSRTVVLTNVSSSLVALGAITPSSGYSETNNCSNALPAGGTCRVFTSFSPVANGEVPGTLTVAYAATGGLASVQLDGTGLIQSDLSVSPLQLNFAGNTIIGSVFGPLTVTLQNTSASTLTVSSVSASPSVFSVSADTCLGPLIAGASCTVNVSFTPTAAGPVSGTLTIVHNAKGNPQIILLSGTGTTQLTLGGETAFGDQEVGTTSGWHFVDASNSSYGSSVTVTSVSVTGDFQIAQGGPGTIPGGYGTAYQVTFSPTAVGPRTGVFTVVASDSPTPHQITLTGNGVLAGVDVSPLSLAFGDLFAGSSSGTQAITITNVSGSAVHFQSISLAGSFSQTNTCGASLAVGANCTIQVTFSPIILGGASGQLEIQDDAAGSPQVVVLSGTGTGPAVRLSTANLVFADQSIGSASPASAVALTNQTSAALAISGISTTGDFAQTNGCGLSLAPGGSCTINVTFSPTATGSRSGVLSISDNGPGSPQTVSLSGIGTPPPSVSLSPTSVNFGGVLVNQTGNGLPVSVNPSGAPLVIQSIDVSSPLFQARNTCPATIPSGSDCTILVIFQPTALGSVSGTMVIHDDAANAPQSIALSGTGSHFVLQPASGGGQIITAGQTGTFGMSLYSVSGVSETVSLSCSGAPAESTCGISQNSLPLTGNYTPLNVTIQTTAHSSIPYGVSRGRRPSGVGWYGGAMLISTALVGALLVLFRIFGWPARVGHAFCVLLLVVLALGLLSCGSASSGDPSGSGGNAPPPPQTGTPSGIYTITVTGTSSNPANPPQTAQFPFTVN